MSNRAFILTPDLLLRAYAAGIFPMADSAQDRKLRWFDPPVRAIIPLDQRFHVPARLRRTIRQHRFQVRADTAFRRVLAACAAPTAQRPLTWINDEIVSLYTTLYLRRQAHSVEVWEDGELVGGLYGVTQGSAFFGESMFSRRTDASKIALVYLVALLRSAGFQLLDTQFQTEHLAQFGTLEITRSNYHHMLDMALPWRAAFSLPPEESWDHLVDRFLQPVTQRS